MDLRPLGLAAALMALHAQCLAQPARDGDAASLLCGRQGPMAFLCGIEAAEDAAPIPGTRWLLTSGLGFGAPGTIKLVDTESGTVASLYPNATAHRADRRAYPECPGPPDATRFSTAGLALERRGRQRYLLYAAHDGGRKSIEVFAIDSRGPLPTLTWIGCIVMPEDSNPNAVAPVGRRALAIVSMDDGSANRMSRHVAGAADGAVYEWRRKTGLRRLPDVRLRGGNGIVASRDGRWLFVSAWSGGELVRLRRDGKAPALVAKLDYLPDNLKWAADGSILVAGQLGPVAAIVGCTGDPCESDWLIAKVDPLMLTSQTIVQAEGTPAVNYATGATEIAGSLYITNRGMSRIGVIEAADLARGVVRAAPTP